MRLLLNLAHEKDFNLICIQNKVKNEFFCKFFLFYHLYT